MYGGGPVTSDIPVIGRAVETVIDAAKHIPEDTLKLVRETPGRVKNAIDAIKSAGQKLYDYYNVPFETKEREFKYIMRQHLANEQESGKTNDDFLKKFVSMQPDLTKRIGILNWIAAGGDDVLLDHWASNSKGNLRAGYEAGRTLSSEDKAVALEVAGKFKEYGTWAQENGILKDMIDNYVTQMWKSAKHNKVELAKIVAMNNAGLFDTDFGYAEQRLFKNYFEGEQAGKTPLNKDAAYVLGAYFQAAAKAIHARQTVRSLIEGKADDGFPLVTPGGSKKVEGVAPSKLVIPDTPEKVESSKDGRPYELFNHPALRDWYWNETRPDGTVGIVKGDMYVHPDIVDHLENVLGTSKIRDYAVGRGALKLSQTFKEVLLTGIPTTFHQVQIGTHAAFHRLNPFNAPELDFSKPMQRFALESGVMAYSHNALAQFSEGLTASGIMINVPGLGRVTKAYGEYLFKDLIPRYKMYLFEKAFERNMERYKNDYTREIVGEITANQVNAAFGELNLKAMGRDPTLQDVFRLAALAPDFLEARMRFVGQAIKPGGTEQLHALMLGASTLVGGAAIFNMLFSDDHKTHLIDDPMSLVIGDTAYGLRSVPGDILHAAKDLYGALTSSSQPKSFVSSRLNPITLKMPMEIASGRDEFGHRVDPQDIAKNLVKAITPIPLQGAWSKGEQNLTIGILKTLGITAHKTKDSADRMISKFFDDHRQDMPADIRRELEHGKQIDKLVDEHIKNPTIESRDKVMGFIQKQVDDAPDNLKEAMQKRLQDRTVLLAQYHNAPDRDFLFKLRYVNNPAIRAEAFLLRYAAVDDKKKQELMQEITSLPGIVTDKFVQEVVRLKSRSPQ